MRYAGNSMRLYEKGLRKGHPDLRSVTFDAEEFLYRYCYDRLPGMPACGNSRCLFLSTYASHSPSGRWTTNTNGSADLTTIANLDKFAQRELVVRLQAIDRFRSDTTKGSVDLPVMGQKVQGGGEVANTDVMVPTLQKEARHVHGCNWDIEAAQLICHMPLGDGCTAG